MIKIMLLRWNRNITFVPFYPQDTLILHFVWPLIVGIKNNTSLKGNATVSRLKKYFFITISFQYFKTVTPILTN